MKYPFLGVLTRYLMGHVSVASRSKMPHKAPLITVLVGVTVLCIGTYFGQAVAGEEKPLEPCAGEAHTHPYLIMDTHSGTMEIQLHVDASPESVARFIQIVKGPIFNESIFGSVKVGYYDGLSFGYTRPMLEIRTSVRQPAEIVEIPIQIDADALGLQDDKIANLDQAMDVMQLELLKAFNNSDKTQAVSNPLLHKWLTEWSASFKADFLMGVSRKEVKQALGHVYITGLNSRPMKRGAVALKPNKPNVAGMELTIALSDLDDRSGEWMVIGEVVNGLEIADDISVQPLRDPPHERSRTYKPYEPVVIRSARIDCR